MIHFLSPVVTRSIGHFKWEIYNDKKISRDLDETLIVPSIGAAMNSTAKVAMMKIQRPRGFKTHPTQMTTPGDKVGFRKLGVNLTSDPNFSSKTLFAG